MNFPCKMRTKQQYDTSVKNVCLLEQKTLGQTHQIKWTNGG